MCTKCALLVHMCKSIYLHSCDSSEEEDADLPADYAESFHEGSDVTVGKAVMLVMQFSIDNHLTYKATGELLKLLQVLCVTPNRLPKSVYLLKKFFQTFKRSEYNHNKVCSNCSKDESNCSCNDPTHGDLIIVSIEKSLEVIVSSKYHLWSMCDNILRI